MSYLLLHWFLWFCSISGRTCHRLIQAFDSSGTMLDGGSLIKKLSIPIDMWMCWINSVRMKKNGISPVLDNQMVRTSEIVLSQPK